MVISLIIITIIMIIVVCIIRYWNQCQSNEASTTDEKIIDPTNTCGTAGAADWKADALEGDLTEFPSIKEKISTMEKPKVV